MFTLLPPWRNKVYNHVCGVQEAQKQQDEDTQRLKQVIFPAIGLVIVLLTLYVLLNEFCQPLTLPPERPRRL